MEFKEDKAFLYATRQARLTDFLITIEEKTMFRNAVYNAIQWSKRH